jgi:hypothetical protein
VHLYCSFVRSANNDDDNDADDKDEKGTRNVQCDIPTFVERLVQIVADEKKDDKPRATDEKKEKASVLFVVVVVCLF